MNAHIIYCRELITGAGLDPSDIAIVVHNFCLEPPWQWVVDEGPAVRTVHLNLTEIYKSRATRAWSEKYRES